MVGLDKAETYGSRHGVLTIGAGWDGKTASAKAQLEGRLNKSLAAFGETWLTYSEIEGRDYGAHGGIRWRF